MTFTREDCLELDFEELQWFADRLSTQRSREAEAIRRAHKR